MKNKVVVFGSFIVDLIARIQRFPVAGETILGQTFQQAIAAHKAGAEVVMVTKLGKDPFAEVATPCRRVKRSILAFPENL